MEELSELMGKRIKKKHLKKKVGIFLSTSPIFYSLSQDLVCLSKIKKFKDYEKIKLGIISNLFESIGIEINKIIIMFKFLAKKLDYLSKINRDCDFNAIILKLGCIVGDKIIVKNYYDPKIENDLIEIALRNNKFNVFEYSFRMDAKYSQSKIGYIWLALKNEKISIADEIYEKCIKSNKMGKEALKCACKYGDEKIISYLHSYLDDFDKDYCIMCCASNGNIAGLKYFEIGKQSNKILDLVFNKTCRYGNLELLKYLAKFKINMRNNSDYGIKTATLYGHYKIVKYILKKTGIKADIYDNILIKNACRSKNLKLFKLLHNYGGNIEAGGITRKLAKLFPSSNIIGYLEINLPYKQPIKNKIKKNITLYL